MEYACPEEYENQRMVVLDLETTGLNRLFNNIIELGVVESSHGKVTLSYSKLFGGGRSSAYLVRNVHGIKDSQRKGKPTFKECAKKIADYLGDAVIVTHNGEKFDIPFMQAKMKEAGVDWSPYRHIDTYLVSKKLDYERHSLEWLCKQFGIPYGEDNHRGEVDSLCTLQLLYALKAKHPDCELLKI